MLNNMAYGKYYSTISNIHKMHPLAKIICTILFILIAIISINIKTTLFLSLLVLIIILNTNIPIYVYGKVVFSLRYILLLIFLICLITRVPILAILSLLLNIILIVLYTVTLTMTTSPTEITYGFELLLYPLRVFKINTSKLALYLSMGLRFIPTLFDETSRILKSEASRGVDYYNSNFRDKIVIGFGLVVPTVKFSIEKIRILMNSMNLRLYSKGRTRTNFRINKWRFFDTYLIIIHLLILFVIVVRRIQI
jgi:energy-coupling factor transport system permease protein